MRVDNSSAAHVAQVEVSAKYQTVATLRQQMLFVPARDKEAHLTCLLNDLAGSSTIVFTATCDNTLRLALMLRNLTFQVGKAFRHWGHAKGLEAASRRSGGRGGGIGLVVSNLAPTGRQRLAGPYETGWHCDPMLAWHPLATLQNAFNLWCVCCVVDFSFNL